MKCLDNMKQVYKDFNSAAVNPNEIKNPKNLSKVCQGIKITSVALAIAALAAAVFTGPISLIFAGLFAVMMFDSYKMANNIEKIADEKAAGQTFPKPVSLDPVTKGTIFAKPILGLTFNKPLVS